MPSDAPAAPARPPSNPLRLFRNRAFLRLFSAGSASVAGQTIGSLALTWLVFTETNSPLDIAYLGVVGVAATASFSLFAGTIVDRGDRRRLMILADVVRAASVAGLLVVLLAFGFYLPAVLVTSFLTGAFSTLFYPAERAFTPTIVSPSELSDANGLTLTSNALIQFGGFGAAGVLIALVGVVVAIALNSATFLLSAILITSISAAVARTREPVSGAARSGFFADTRAGVAYLGARPQRGLLWLTVSAGAANFFVVFIFTFLVVYTTRVLHGGSALYGFEFGAFSLGFAPGALLTGRLHTERYAGKVWVYGSILAGVALLGVALTSNAAFAFAMLLLVGVILGLTNTTWLTTVQLVVPTELQGRYFGLDQLGSIAVVPAGALLGGLLVAAHGVVASYLVGALGWLTSAALSAIPPSLRALRYDGPSAGGPTGPAPPPAPSLPVD